jgi:pteridine reductase
MSNNTRPVAVVTGSGKQRVGWHVADAVARRGFDVVVHYNRSAAEAKDTAEHLRGLGACVLVVQADLTDEKAVHGLVARVLAEFGRIDLLAHCAAVWRPKRLEEVTAEEVRYFFETNTLATFLCCQAVGLAMTRQASGGVIVTFGDWAETRPYLDYAAYFPSKGAIPALTRTFAVELGTRNPRVRVNGILPGPVMLPPDLPEAERAEAIAGTLVQREGSPTHIAQAVLFFYDNDFVTGACLPVDGGRSIFAPSGR